MTNHEKIVRNEMGEIEGFKPQSRQEIVFGCLENFTRAYHAIGQPEIFFEYESALGKLLIEANKLDKKVLSKYKFGFKGFNLTFVSLL